MKNDSDLTNPFSRHLNRLTSGKNYGVVAMASNKPPHLAINVHHNEVHFFWILPPKKNNCRFFFWGEGFRDNGARAVSYIFEHRYACRVKTYRTVSPDRRIGYGVSECLSVLSCKKRFVARICQACQMLIASACPPAKFSAALVRVLHVRYFD